MIRCPSVRKRIQTTMKAEEMPSASRSIATTDNHNTKNSPPRDITPYCCALGAHSTVSRISKTLAQTYHGNVVNNFVNPLFHFHGKQTVVRTRLSSSVQTRRAHNLIFLGAVSSACFNSISIPSHQHLRCRTRQGGRPSATSSHNPERAKGEGEKDNALQASARREVVSALLPSGYSQS